VECNYFSFSFIIRHAVSFGIRLVEIVAKAYFD